ncbi:MAG: branched-chain amino acid transport system permease protein [Actinomycetota bacterium]|jgi:branched-chain amino acid transport system permease protein|nr:branched-chain amino acid transport system permease protein [Actinomycetota bacterium]
MKVGTEPLLGAGANGDAVTSEIEPALDTPQVAPPTRRRGLSRVQFIGIGLLLLLAALPIPFGDFGFFVGQYALIYAILGMSVVVVTGYAGLISLMPYSFAGIGAMTTGVAMASWGWPFWLAALLAAVATVPVAVLVGISSVRLKGLYLAIATLTFSNALGETLFKWGSFTGGQSGWSTSRPVVGPIDFNSDISFYLLCLVVVFALLWMIEGLRTSRIGRAMLAVRDNELEAQALGINVYKTKLTAFVLGGMVAGLGGAFLAALVQLVTPTGFQSPIAEATSILLVTLVAIGGMDRAIGAFFGAVSLVVQQQIFQGAEFFYAFVGIYAAAVLILFLMFRPGGLVQVGRIQLDLIRSRPVFGMSVVIAIVAANVGVAWLFVSLSS